MYAMSILKYVYIYGVISGMLDQLSTIMWYKVNVIFCSILRKRLESQTKDLAILGNCNKGFVNKKKHIEEVIITSNKNLSTKKKHNEEIR